MQKIIAALLFILCILQVTEIHAQDAASMVNDSVETRAASRTRIVDTKNVRVITSPGTRSFSA